MSNPQPEPSMEEILASIRRIISEDGEEAQAQEKAAEGGAPDAGADPAPASTPASTTASTTARQTESRPELRLDRPVAEEKTPSETEGLEIMKRSVAEAMQEDEQELLDETAAQAASKAFESLSQSVRVSSGSERTLEEIVVEMLRPMVKDWLDANLPAIVEEKVEAEVQRLARRRR